MSGAPNSIHTKATALLIMMEGGRRFCSSCQRMRDAAGFVKTPTKRGAILRCSICAERRAPAATARAVS